MRDSFAYVGNETVGSMVEARLGALGYVRTSDVGSARTVVTYCTSQTALEDAYFDEGGLVQAAAAGTLLVDLSPSTPGFARELNAVAAVSDLVAVEAPLAVVDPVRADAFSDKGNLVCFAAGDEDALAAARPVVEAVAGPALSRGAALLLAVRRGGPACRCRRAFGRERAGGRGRRALRRRLHGGDVHGRAVRGAHGG